MINHVVISLLCVNEVIFLSKKGGIQTAQEVGSKITVLNLIGSISAALSCLACVPPEQRLVIESINLNEGKRLLFRNV